MSGIGGSSPGTLCRAESQAIFHRTDPIHELGANRCHGEELMKLGYLTPWQMMWEWFTGQGYVTSSSVLWSCLLFFLVFRCGRVWMWLKLRARCWERPILLTPCQEPSEGIMLWKWAGQFSDASVPQHLLIITVFNSVKYYLVLILFALCLFCRNVIHGSDSVESAQREISLWFGQDELQCWEDTHNHWLYNWTGLRSEAASHSLNHHLFFFVGLMTSWMTYLSSLYWLQ